MACLSMLGAAAVAACAPATRIQDHARAAPASTDAPAMRPPIVLSTWNHGLPANRKAL
jgi:hypothetical protein